MTHVELIPQEVVNSDLGVVNAARVSFAKQREEILLHGDPRIPEGESGDDRLINYLAKHGHWSPLAHPHFTMQLVIHPQLQRQLLVSPAEGVRLSFTGRSDEFFVNGSLYGLARLAIRFEEHESGIAQKIRFVLKKVAPLSCQALGLNDLMDQPMSGGYRVDEHEVVARYANSFALGRLLTRTFRIKAPIFVARQLVKHQRDLVWNEVSRRYVDAGPEFFTPETWRARADNAKQGSAGAHEDQAFCNRQSDLALRSAEVSYEELLKQGVCPEQARMVLPQSMLTEWWWTGTVQAFARVVRQRTDPHAQAETRLVAEKMDALLAESLGDVWNHVRLVEGTYA